MHVVLKKAVIGLVMSVVPLAWVFCGLAAASGGGAAMTAEEALRKLMEENTNYVADKLTKQSAMLKHLVEIQKLTIVAAKYDLDDGMVSLL